MNAECARWIQTADREAWGEPLSDEDRTFMREHASSCLGCRAEEGLWQKLSEQPAAGAVQPDAAVIDRVIATLQAERAQRKAGGRGRLAAAAAGLALAAGAVLALTWPKDAPRSSPPSPAVSVYLTLLSGKPALGPTIGEVARGAAVATGTGSACLRIEPAVRACAGQNSQVRVANTELHDRRLDLISGTLVVSLAPQPPGASLSVSTRHGTITAKGTTFAVEIVNDTTVLRVEHGTVVAHALGQAPRQVHENEKLVLGQPGVVALDSAEAERDRQLVHRGSLWSGGQVATIEVPATAAGSLVRLDGIALGHAPLSALVAPGPHRLELGEGDIQPLELAAGERVIRGPSVAPAPVAAAERSAPAPVSKPAPSASTAAETPVPPAPELLKAARDLRGRGQLREAAAAYRALQAAHPNSAEARASVVSLGEVEIALGELDGAVRSFDAYLVAGGPLAQEARYGKIRALTMRGRSAEAEQETAEFLRLYPDSVQARALRKQK